MFYGRGLQIFHKTRSHLKTEVPGGDAIRIWSEDACILGCHTKCSRLDALSPLFCRLMHCSWQWNQWNSYEFVWFRRVLLATYFEALFFSMVLWDVTLSYLVYIGQHFRGTWQHRLLCRSVFVFCLEDGSSKFLQYSDTAQPNHTSWKTMVLTLNALRTSVLS